MYRYGSIHILKTEIKVGLSKPVKFLHVTDSHIAIDDQGEDCGRAKVFEKDKPGSSEYYFRQAVEYAKKKHMPIVHTGDLIDFLSNANLAFADKAFDGVEHVYAAGNHDFCHQVGAAKEDAVYKWMNMKRTAPHFQTNLIFSSKVIGGVNVVTLDNSYYQISAGQMAMLQAEAARGYPIILCMHVPIFTVESADTIMSRGKNCGYLMCPTDAYLAGYPENRRQQQTPNQETKQAVEYIKSEPLIRTIITGHTHMNYEQVLENGVMQITTHGSYAGYAREITLL